VLAGVAWWALAAGHLADAAVFAADAAKGAFASGDSTTQVLADTAVAAVKATADPTGANTCAFTALSRRRPQRRPIAPSPTSQTWPRLRRLALPPH
jgi:hypothetical protein